MEHPTVLERMTINLSSVERQALEVSAKNDFRDIRSHIRFLLRKELEQQGILRPESGNSSDGNRNSEGINSFIGKI